jgi:tol-pal system protein YbgF
MKRFALLLPAALVAGCVSGTDIESVQAQLNELQRQILQLQKQTSGKEEVAGLQTAIATQTRELLKSEADMQVELGKVSAQVDQLQAKLEDTNERLAQLSQLIAATNQELKTYRAAAPAVEGPGGQMPSPGSDPQALYQAAYGDYVRGNYDLAMLGFQQYVEAFADTELADNAAYWIGECYYRQGKFRQAVQEFENVLARYPRSDKSASAWLKKGYAYLELGERAQGVVQLQHVVREYPGSDEANLARQRLHELGVDLR